MRDNETIKENEAKGASEKSDAQDSDNRCCYAVDACGCYVDPCCCTPVVSCCC